MFEVITIKVQPFLAKKSKTARLFFLSEEFLAFLRSFLAYQHLFDRLFRFSGLVNWAFLMESQMDGHRFPPLRNSRSLRWSFVQEPLQ
jgi:hypothetical protein